MKQEGFSVGERAIVKKGARITTNDGKEFINELSHEQTIIVGQLLDRDGDRPLLVCWKENGVWCEASEEYCSPLAPAED